jgi:hypothetical protein
VTDIATKRAQLQKLLEAQENLRDASKAFNEALTAAKRSGALFDPRDRRKGPGVMEVSLEESKWLKRDIDEVLRTFIDACCGPHGNLVVGEKVSEEFDAAHGLKLREDLYKMLVDQLSCDIEGDLFDLIERATQQPPTEACLLIVERSLLQKKR